MVARKLLCFVLILAWILFVISDRLPAIWKDYLLLRSDGMWLSRDACTFLLLGLYISHTLSESSQEDTSEQSQETESAQPSQETGSVQPSQETGSVQPSQEVPSSHAEETEQSFWSEVHFLDWTDL